MTWTYHARQIRTLRNEPDTQSNPTRNICQTRGGKRMKEKKKRERQGDGKDDQPLGHFLGYPLHRLQHPLSTFPQLPDKSSTNSAPAEPPTPQGA